MEVARTRPEILAEAPLHIGVIAQSLPPGVQVYDKSVDMYGVSTTDMAGFTLAAIRGVRVENRDAQGKLEAKMATTIAERDRRIAALEARLSALETGGRGHASPARTASTKALRRSSTR